MADRSEFTATRETRRAQSMLRQGIIMLVQGRSLAEHAATHLRLPPAEIAEKMRKRQAPYSLAVSIHDAIRQHTRELDDLVTALEVAAFESEEDLAKDFESFQI